MTKEEIIRMAREAVKGHSEYYDGCPDPEGEDLEVFVKFSELVIAAEREECAKVCETHTVDDVLVGVGIAIGVANEYSTRSSKHSASRGKEAAAKLLWNRGR